MVSGCSGLSSEPEIDHIIPPVPTQTQAIFGKVADIGQGAQVFAANCVQCHGNRGAGDGSLVQSGQVSMTADFTDPKTPQNNSLQNWFTTITNGRLYALMPPWEDALTVEERWAVALYTYTLAYTSDSIDNGSQGYINQCATCHGDIGAGSDTAPPLLGLLGYTDTRLLEKLTTHQTDLKLTPSIPTDDLMDITRYLRLLSTSTRTLPESITPDVFTPNSATTVLGSLGTITGRVRLGTDSATLPNDLIVTLTVYDNQFNLQTTEYPVDNDGTYQFDDVEVRADLAYLVSVNHEGWRFVSDVVVADPKQTDRVIDVTLYESTDDLSVIEMTGRITQVNLTAQGLYVMEIINLRNNADKMLIRELSDETVDVASIEIPIPPNAQLQLSATDASRFRVNQSGTLLFDTYPAIPDMPHIIQFAYVLPFADTLTLTQPIHYQITGAVQLYIEDPLLTLQSEQTHLVGNHQSNGFNYRAYEVTENPDIGQAITYTIMTSASQATQSQAVIPRDLLAIGLVLVGVILTLVGSIILLRGNHAPSDSTVAIEDIIQQIVELDKQYEAGTLDASTYQTQRDAFKAKIADKVK